MLPLPLPQCRICLETDALLWLYQCFIFLAWLVTPLSLTPISYHESPPSLPIRHCRHRQFKLHLCEPPNVAVPKLSSNTLFCLAPVRPAIANFVPSTELLSSLNRVEDSIEVVEDSIKVVEDSLERVEGSIEVVEDSLEKIEGPIEEEEDSIDSKEIVQDSTEVVEDSWKQEFVMSVLKIYCPKCF